ncbi:hypothetical protein CONPUDRAFT_43553, partial [Coniophora puteana RWD-64-598 SS2]
TLLYVRCWCRKPKVVRDDILNTVDSPPCPWSEWLNLVTGQAVNLETIHAATNSSAIGYNETADVGSSFEISFRGAEEARAIKRYGDWVTCWTYAMDAYAFLFPWRTRELVDYMRHICQLFTSTTESVHARVLSYDRAVRLLIGRQRGVRFNDFATFEPLRLAHLHTIGIVGSGLPPVGKTPNAAGPSSSGSKNKRRKDESCNRFNGGVCPNDAASC